MKRLLALLLALVMLLSLAACGSKESSGEQAQDTPSNDTAPAAPTITENDVSNVEEDSKYGGSVSILFTAFPTTCLISTSTRSGDAAMLQPVLEQLGRMNPETYVYEPFLAESMEVDADALTLTIKVRSGIQFSDGSPLDAEAVAWNLQMYVDSGKGADLGNPVSIEIVDDSTVVLTYASFSNTWVDQVSLAQMYSKKAYEENGADWCASHAVGTGPFVMDEFRLDDRIVYSRNENYWQEGLPYLDGMETVYLADNTTILAAFLNKEIDSVQGEGAPFANPIMEAGNENVAAPVADNHGIEYLVPNSFDESSPFYNDDVRTAVFNYGINWDDVAYALTDGLGYTIHQWAVESSLNYVDGLTRTYDPEKAKQMLADAGYPDGFDTVIYTGNEESHRTRATIVQAALAELGINATIEQYDDSVLATMRRENTAGIWCTAMPMFYDISSYMYNRLSRNSDELQQIVRYSDAYQAAVDRAFAAETLEEKCAALQEATRLLCVDEAMVVPLDDPPRYVFEQPYVHGTGYRQTTAWEWSPETAWTENK